MSNNNSHIVADSSTLIHLSKIGRFHPLRDLYKKISIPRGVYTEVVEKGSFNFLPG